MLQCLAKSLPWAWNCLNLNRKFWIQKGHRTRIHSWKAGHVCIHAGVSWPIDESHASFRHSEAQMMYCTVETCTHTHVAIICPGYTTMADRSTCLRTYVCTSGGIENMAVDRWTATPQPRMYPSTAIPWVLDIDTFASTRTHIFTSPRTFALHRSISSVTSLQCNCTWAKDRLACACMY